MTRNQVFTCTCSCFSTNYSAWCSKAFLNLELFKFVLVMEIPQLVGPLSASSSSPSSCNKKATVHAWVHSIFACLLHWLVSGLVDHFNGSVLNKLWLHTTLCAWNVIVCVLSMGLTGGKCMALCPKNARQLSKMPPCLNKWQIQMDRGRPCYPH